MAEVDGLALGQEALCIPGGREAWKWGLDAVVLLSSSVLPGSFWSPRPHTPLLRPPDPMALRSKPYFFTSACEAPAIPASFVPGGPSTHGPLQQTDRVLRPSGSVSCPPHHGLPAWGAPAFFSPPAFRAQLQRSLLQEAHLSSAVLTHLIPLGTCTQKSSSTAWPGVGGKVCECQPGPRPCVSCK